jgi:hypothetical protein
MIRVTLKHLKIVILFQQRAYLFLFWKQKFNLKFFLLCISLDFGNGYSKIIFLISLKIIGENGACIFQFQEFRGSF